MNQKDMARLALIQGAIDGKYTVAETARKLGLCVRRVKQLKRAVRLNGPQAVIHGNAGRHPANYTDEALRERIIALKGTDDYREANFTHYRELLAEREGIEISYTNLCGVLKKAGIESKRKHRTDGRQFTRRKRKEKPGELLQADATSFDWFGRGTRAALHGFIDDATGKITALYLCENECLMGYLEVLRTTLREYGVPEALYTDKAGVFYVNTKKEENWNLDEQLAGKTLDKTQFGRIADKLGMGLILAHTPQAKGRIERLWGTLQDRLPVWFKVNKISSIEEANAALPRFIAEYNKSFGVEPENTESAFTPVIVNDEMDKLLSVRHERVTDNCGCFSFQNFLFEIKSGRPLAKKRIVFLFSGKIGFQAMYEQKYYPVSVVGFANKRGDVHLPEVTRALLTRHYLADGKAV